MAAAHQVCTVWHGMLLWRAPAVLFVTSCLLLMLLYAAQGREYTTLDIGDGIEYALFSLTKLTFQEADAYCKARGTNLVKITSKDQADKLHAAVRNVLPSPAPGTDVWLRWSYWWVFWCMCI